MSQKIFYVVQHAIPFPASEYGGIWNVIAENDDECFDIISNSQEYDGYDTCFPVLKENIMKSEKFFLSNEEESRIVEVFVT